MLRSRFHQLGLILGAFGHDKRTTWVEVAAGRGVKRAGHLAGDNQILPLVMGMGRKGGIHKLHRVRMQRIAEELQAFRYLHDFTQTPYDNTLANVGYCCQVVADKQVAHSQGPLKLLQQAENVGSNGDIQGGHRLV